VAVVSFGRVEAVTLQTWRRCAVLLGLLAQRTRVAKWANAIEFAHHVHTFASVSARGSGALVYVRLAIATRESRGTGAPIVVDQINAGGSIPALTHAVIQILGTGHSAPALLADAGKGTRLIAALLGIDAGSDGQGCGCHCTGQSGQKSSTAQITTNNRGGCGGQQCVRSDSGGMRRLALVHIHLTDIAMPLRRTFTSKATD